MFRRIAWACLVALGPTIAGAQEPTDALVRQIETCANYDACFKIFDENENRVPTFAREFAARLERFGDRAKQELIRRALAPEPWNQDWYEAPDHVLRYWQNWSEADFPIVRQIMEANPDSQVSWVLAGMGTDRATKELVDNLAKNGGLLPESPLVAIVDKAIPHIMNGLGGSEWHGYRSQIFDLHMRMPLPTDQWAAYAVDPMNATIERIARLRALASLKEPTAFTVRAIAPLLESTDPLILTEAVRAASKAKLVVPADALGKACPLRPDPFTSGSPGPQTEDDWTDCLYDLAVKGEAARPTGMEVMRKFLNSANGYDRAEAASALGYIGFSPAIPRLTELLNDQDWRVVFASVRALGWLGAKDAVPALERVADEHWLSELQSFAHETVAALRTQEGRLQRPDQLVPYFGGLSGASPQNRFNVDASIIHEENSCVSERWDWQGRPIRWRHDASGFLIPSERSNNRVELRIAPTRGLPRGRLSGTDIGEWGGALLWQPDRGPAVSLYKSNVIGLAQDSDKVIAIVGEGGPQGALIFSNGPTGVGFTLRLTRDSTGIWVLAEAARFPTGVSDLTRIGRDLFAAHSGGRVIVFSGTKIVGLATCAGGQ